MQALADQSKSEIGKEASTKTGVNQDNKKLFLLLFVSHVVLARGGKPSTAKNKDEIEMGRRRIETHRCAQGRKGGG